MLERMATKPNAAMVMHPVVQDELLREDHMQRIAQATRLIAPLPFRDFDDLGEQCSQVEVLITSWGCPRIDLEVVKRLPRLRLIAHLAGSVKGFLDEEVWRRGVRVTNAVAANAVPVAEYTVAAILFANKRVLQLAEAYREHRKNRAPWTQEAPNAGNYRKTVGIIGASSVGQLVIRLLQPYDLRVLLFDPYMTPMASRKLGAHKVGMSELLSRSDVVSLHAPLLEDTRGMIGAREMALMADGTTLINTARGQLVDTAALTHELVTGRLNAVLDTTDPEVLPEDSPLYDMPNVLLTPHIAGSLGSEAERLSDYIVEEVERFATGAPMKHLVTREQLPRLA
jgi:phosphoglycerate dehydrogenase-like enzyme